MAHLRIVGSIKIQVFKKLTTNEPMHIHWIYPFAALVAILVNTSNNAYKAGHVSIHVDANIDTIKYGI
jgi:hypothetical protein